jgi:hypothetical protein
MRLRQWLPAITAPYIRKTPLHVPATGASIRQGLSNMFDARTIPERVACSPLSETTWLPHGQQSPTHPSGAGVNRPVGDNSMGAAVNVHTGSRRAACGTMSVRAVRRLTGPARTAAPPRRVRDAGPNPRSILWPSRCVC